MANINRRNKTEPRRTWLPTHLLTSYRIRFIRDNRRQRLALRWSLKHLHMSRSEMLALSLIVILGFILRVIFVTQPIRTDEAVTYLHYASRSLPTALSNYSAPNNHLFHTFWVWVSVHLFGNTELALRLPAFLMGVLLIPVAYVIGCVMSNRWTGLLAAGLIAVSSVLIEYSTNARGYTLQCVLVGLSVLMAYSVRHSLSPTRWGLLAVLLALGFYTVPTMLYPFGGLMLWLLSEIVLGKRGKSFIRAWFFCGLLTAFITLGLYVPVLIVSGLSSIIGNQYVQPLPFSEFLQHLPDAAVHLWAHWHMSIPSILAAIFSLGAVISLGKGIKGRIPLLIPCLIWSLIALALQRVIPFERNWMPFLPLYLVSAAAGLVWVWERGIKQEVLGWVIGGVLIVGLAVNVLVIQSPYVSIETGTFRDAQAIAQDLQPLVKQGDRVIWEHPSGDSLTYYASQLIPDWEAYIQWEQTPGFVYVVLNKEYPQSIESIARWNLVKLEDYSITSIGTYPQAELFRLTKEQ